MANEAVQPGARVVWCLKRRSTDVRCVLIAQSIPVQVQVVHDREILVSEVFQEEWMALEWARAYRAGLRDLGWNDVPDRVSGP